MEMKAFKDISLSRLGMGNMRLPKCGSSDKDIDYAVGQDIIDYAYAHGINYYDTAYVYHGGESEVFLGKALKKYDRKSVYIATKFNINANPDHVAVFEEQLKRLDTDYIDFYLIHCVMDSNIDRYIDGGCIDYFLQKQAEGKIKYLGFSFHGSIPCMERFASLRKWDFAQIQLNYFDWSYGSAKKEYEILTEKGIPVMVMEPIRGGRLASLTPEAEAVLKAAHPDWSVASWALRFVRSLDNTQVILSGMGAMNQIEDNVATFEDDYKLTEADQAVLDKALDLFHSQIVVPCTECRYCTPDCPMSINIPEILKVYNKYKLQGGWALKALEKVDSEGKPQDCIGCGACMGHCPQSIQIPDIMAELTEALK